MKKVKVLTVGDWFVDEHWVTGIHRSSTSSRTGKEHYRALHEMNSTVQSFCGAGRVASLLFQVKETANNSTEQQAEINSLFEIHGVGLWHKKDTDELKRMFDVNNLKGQNLFRLSRDCNAIPKTVFLYNLAGALDDNVCDNVCSTRILRIYNSVGANKYEYQRIDWELPSNKVEFSDNGLSNCLSGLPENIDIVVVKDMRKGVVNDKIIDLFINKYSKAKWFVSSKEWKPSWFNRLKNVDLRLLLIPQIAAQETVRNGLMSRWIAQEGYPSEEAIELITDLSRLVRAKENLTRIIVLPDGYSLLGLNLNNHALVFDNAEESIYKDKNLDLNTNDPDTIIQTISKQEGIAVDLGMASAFLPSYISNYMSNPDQPFDVVIKESLQKAFSWAYFEANRITKPDIWNPTDYVFNSDCLWQKEFLYKLTKSSWLAHRHQWHYATKGNAVINKDDEKYIELSRAMVDVNGYVCCDVTKKREIRKLVKSFKSFQKDSVDSHMSCMLIAAPGSGKTYLVQKIAESLNMRFLTFNITQMIERVNILDCFDTIVTTQAQDPSKPILVFIDEINAKLGDEVYDIFLAPIEDGRYVRNGKTFSIKPCIWVFCGTNKPKETGQKKSFEVASSNKASDFISRLNLGVIDISIPDNSDYRKLENVYLGVSLLKQKFPDVRKVSEKVLKVFKNIPSSMKVRDFKYFINSFVNIQHGEVSSLNIPKDLIEKYSLSELNVWTKIEGIFVNIKE